MSDQSDALKKNVREKGIHVDGPNPPLPGLEEEAGRPDLPHVKLPRGGKQLRQFAKEIGAIVGANGLFRREMVPVTIDPESGRIEDMNAQRLRSYVEDQLVTYEEVLQRRTGMVALPETMGVDEARGCLECDAFKYPLRKLRRVNFVRLPVIRADGTMELLQKGYDTESGIYTKKEGLEYATDWDLERSIRFYESFHAEVPFANPRSRAVHICAHVAVMGSAFLQEGAKRLNFCYRANKPRSGKGLFLQSTLVGPCGPFIEVQAISDSKEEFRKMLDTEALNGSPYIFLDEVENKLRNRTLNAFITCTRWTGRLFHSQKKFAVPQQTIVFIAGNNIDLDDDLTGRFLLVDLYVAQADPQDRNIEHPIDEQHLAKDEVRADLLSATWGLFNAWNLGIGAEIERDGNGKLTGIKIVKRDPRPEPSSVYRGFETFSRLFGGVTQNAGFGNPMESTAKEVNPDYADMLEIVEQLAEGVQRHAEYEFDQLIDICRRLNLFEWHLEGKVVKYKEIEKELDAAGEVVGSGEVEKERFDLTPAKKSFFGKLFSKKYGGTMFTIKDGRSVQFGKRGENRQRRYTIEIVESV